jgi:5'-3' exonuclease
VVFNFFRQFKSLVDRFKPNRVYVVLEGKPVKRYEALAEYKANRKVEADDPRAEELAQFFKQKDVIVDLLTKYFPVSVVRHPTSECDDTIANLIRTSSTAVDWVIVSSDTDFTQILHDRPNVRLYNPVQDKFVEAPTGYDYCVWKALRGDATDNIPGIPGVGDKTAAKLASDPNLLAEFIYRPEVKPIFERNYNLVRFQEWSEEERLQMTSSSPTADWDAIKSVFEGYGFNSMVKDGSWQKYVSSFENLWGNNN